MITKPQRDHLCRITRILSKTEGWPDNRFPRNYLVLDIETLGFNPGTDRIVQLGLCAVENDQFNHELWNEDYKAITLKWPKECFVDKESAISVHHMDFEHCSRVGVEPDDAFCLLRDICEYYVKKGFFLVGHNCISFDVPFLNRAMYDYGYLIEVDKHRLIDTGLIVKALQLGTLPGENERAYDYFVRVKQFRARGVFFALDRFCLPTFDLDKRYGASATIAHDAGYDSWMTSLVLREINYCLEGVYDR